eukprot:817814-Pyramimonas_sp.AAC.1
MECARPLGCPLGGPLGTVLVASWVALRPFWCCPGCLGVLLDRFGVTSGTGGASGSNSVADEPDRGEAPLFQTGVPGEGFGEAQLLHTPRRPEG